MVVFLLETAAWALSDPDRALREIESAVARQLPVPETAPIWEQDRGRIVATLAEALKAKRNTSLLNIFGDPLLLEDTFCCRVSPPAVWMDVSQLSPLNITITIDGCLVRDPQRLLELALRVAEPLSD